MAPTLVTGASGSIGSALIPRLLRDGHAVRAFARDPARVRAEVPVVRGDVLTGAGLDEALDGIEVAYYLIHSMEAAAGRDFSQAEAASAQRFARAAARAGVQRVVYLGGLVPARGALSRHLGSRLAVEELLLAAVPAGVAFRASIVIGPGSRSFRFLVRLVERTPVIPLPGWRANRTQPVDERDVVAYLAAAATSPRVDRPLSVDLAGPDVVTYGQLVEHLRDHLLIGRPTLSLPISLTPVAAQVAAAIAGEDPSLVEPLMESLSEDLLPRDDLARRLFPEVRLHGLDAAIERSLRDWERSEPLRAR